MRTDEVTAEGACVYLALDEVLLLSNALNEVCNGLDVSEFATRMGLQRDEALALLKSIGDLYDKVAGNADGVSASK